MKVPSSKVEMANPCDFAAGRTLLLSKMARTSNAVCIALSSADKIPLFPDGPHGTPFGKFPEKKSKYEMYASVTDPRAKAVGNGWKKKSSIIVEA